MQGFDPALAIVIITAATAIVTAVFTSVTSIIIGILSYKAQQRAAVKVDQAAVKVEEVKTQLASNQDAVGDQLKTIHTAVNSERTTMIDRLEQYHKEVLRLTTANVKLQDAGAKE